MPTLFKKGDLFFGFLKVVRNKRNEMVIRPVWGRVLTLLTGLTVAGWFAAALAVMIFVQQKHDFQSGRYVDIVLPWRWQNYRVAWGEEFIERGLAMIKEGKVREGIHFVRVGHVKSPSNLEARKVVADLYAAANRPDLAANVLREGLPNVTDDIDYLRTTLRLLLANHDDAGVQEVVKNILPAEPKLTPFNQVAALAGATAHFHRGNYDSASDMIFDYRLETNPEGRILLARVDWESGNRDAALERLEKEVEKFTDDDDVYILLGQYYRELGDPTKAHNLAVLRQLNNPMSAAPRIALLYSYFESDETDRTAREANRILEEFAQDPAALGALGEFAAGTGNVDLVRQVFAALDRGGFPLDSGAILVAETYIEANRYRDAIEFLESHAKLDQSFQKRHESVLNGLFALAYLGLENNDTGQMYLTQFLNGRRLRAESYLIISRRLLEQGQREHARRVINHAHQIDPQNQAALVQLIRLDLETGRTDDLVGFIAKLMTMRKPPRALLEDSVNQLSGDKFLFLENRDNLLRSILDMIDGSSAAKLTHS